MLRIIVAPDSFKESLASPQVAAAIAAGIQRVLPEAEIIKTPMADGGEGLAPCLFSALGGTKNTRMVTDPQGKPINTEWFSLEDGTAVIEMAAASGLALVPRSDRNPCTASTYGTGELIKAALDAGHQRIIVGIGGSATSDGGVGMARALGVRFLDSVGRDLSTDVPALCNLQHIDISHLHPGINKVELIGACDVNNPLFGPMGAAHIYAPQKGATPEMVMVLDAAMTRLAQVAAHDLGKDLATWPGAGGGGGMGFGLMAFAGAALTSGLDLMCTLTGFDEVLKAGADLVITGEGQLNEQSLYGKVPSGIAARARQYGIPVLAIVGSIALDGSTAALHGLDAVVSIAPGPISLNESINRASELLADAAERSLRIFGLKQIVS